jgi:hypothetical protein
MTMYKLSIVIFKGITCDEVLSSHDQRRDTGLDWMW